MENADAILTVMSETIRQIEARKEALVRAALLDPCPMRGCTAGVRTARWVVEMGGSPPFVERLVLTCDAGHEWYQRLTTEVAEKTVTLRSVRFPVPFEADLFRAMEAAVEESVPGALGAGGVDLVGELLHDRGRQVGDAIAREVDAWVIGDLQAGPYGRKVDCP